MTKDEADSALAMAIAQHAEVYGNRREGDMLNHYAVIAHWVGGESGTDSLYTTAFHTESVPNHISEGLFRTGVSICHDQSWSESD